MAVHSLSPRLVRQLTSALVEQTEIFERDATARLDRGAVANLPDNLEPSSWMISWSRVQRAGGRVRRLSGNCPQGQWRGAPKLRIMGCNEGQFHDRHTYGISREG